VFNLADAAISIGVALLLIDSMLRPDTPRQDADSPSLRRDAE
jgi:lipoprotein signal peptidase